MTDQRFTELLSKQIAGEISAAEIDELNFLLANNNDLQQEYESLRGYFNRPESVDENIDAVFQRIKKQLVIPQPEVQPPVLQHPAKQSIRTWYRIAAIFILLIGSVAAYRFYDNLQITQNPKLSWKSVSTPFSKRGTLTLSDGTQVTLNSATELKYPADFKGDIREVYLSGEAFFDVKKDPKHPFIIHTKKIEVKVLGTAFDVKAYSNDASTETTLLRGLVEITLKNNSSSPITIKPGEKFTLTNATDIHVVDKLNYYTLGDSNSIIETSWTRNELLFKNNDFATLSKLFERWYGVKIIFKDEPLKSLRYTGQFTNENITEALNALKMIQPFNYKIQDKIVYIYK